eukprot:954824-Karenia_brevis.AAC.1
MRAGIAVPREVWEEGPGGLMSLADMLKLAGYSTQIEEWIPPPPATLAPHNYVEPPPPPSP